MGIVTDVILPLSLAFIMFSLGLGLYYRHNYDLSNAILWTRDSEPTGLNKLPFLDGRINTAWKDFLESSGQADLVCLTLEK